MGLIMQSRSPTAEEKEWLNLLAQMPCIVCSECHGVHDSPAEIHHINGKTRKNAHLKTIALCSKHHRHKDNNHPSRWISRHGDGRTIFQEKYMNEYALLDRQREAVAKMRLNIV